MPKKHLARIVGKEEKFFMDIIENSEKDIEMHEKLLKFSKFILDGAERALSKIKDKMDITIK